ncbi:ATP-binding protein [Pandoraea sp. NPDC087047]|uniref:ATP-binding protein n=1 Tax=Pandoraea sp. NPDC087047 TaxID=3364390 RepID=UPI003817BBE8
MALVHELRAPLQVLQGHLDALWDDAGDAAPTLGPRKRLGTMRSMLDVLSGAVDDVLRLGRGEIAHLPLRETAFEVRECLDAEVDAFAARAHAKGLDLACDIADDVPVVLWGDATRLRQILRTLLDNALKYTACGGVAVRVSWTNQAGEAHGEDCDGEAVPMARQHEDGAGCLTIHVTDTGPGIPAGMENAVFAAFARADPSVPGTGLGLWIAQRWAQRMGGALHVEPSAAGARFRLSMPFSMPGEISRSRNMPLADAQCDADIGSLSSSSAPSALSVRSARSTRPALSHPPPVVQVPVADVTVRPGLQALVVDDHVMNRTILTDQLASLGCHAIGAADLTEALVQWVVLDIDVVLTDIQLGGECGLTLAKTLRALAPALGRRAPVVFAVTGSVVEARTAREAGIDGVLTKPVSRQRLSQTLAVRWPCQDEALEALEGHDVQEGHAAHAPHKAREVPDARGAGERPAPLRPPLKDDPRARRMMREEMAKDLARFRRLMVGARPEDIDAAQRLLHRMRGACRMFGDPVLTARCDRLADRLAQCRMALVRQRARNDQT